MNEPTTLPQVTAWIGAEASDDDLSRILAVVKERRRMLAAEAAAKVTRGASVEIVNIKPAVLKGMRGTVSAIEGRYADVKLTPQSTAELRVARSTKINVPRGIDEYEVTGIPLTCLRLV
ncbi:hypothetical protein [Streptomyces sp. NPDC002952]|uniref:hypothetical protein n=1 Tax=Streptomyces sp. NPDC002952 TaxID=3364673 RepID=UPI003679B07C